jgi:hypothetical protein
LTLKNIELFAREVMPHFRSVWDEDGWDNKWWPAGLKSNGKTVGTTGGISEAEMHAGK